MAFYRIDEVPNSIYYMSEDTAIAKRLTFPPSDVDIGDQWVALSPDGQWMSFARQWSDEGMDGLWIIKNDGSNAQRIFPTSPDKPARMSSWSPNSDKLVFQVTTDSSNEDSKHFEVWLWEGSNTVPQRLIAFQPNS